MSVWRSGIAVIVAWFIAATASAQDATRPARIIVPFPPGGINDVVARVLAQRIGERWGQTILVENRAGGGTIIGTEVVAKAAPDGHTLLLTSIAHAINPSIYKSLPYDPRAFTPISLIVASPFILSVRPSLPAQNVKELVALARAQPGKLTYSSTGSGGSSHLMGEMLRSMAGYVAVHVPYKGMTPAVADVMGGQVDFTFGSYSSTGQFIRAGRLRALGVSSQKRLAVMPELPTIAEQGYPDFDANPWWGLVLPSGTPESIAARWHAEVVRIVRSLDVTKAWQEQGLEIIASTPADYARHFEAEVARWAKIVKASGATAE